MKLGSRLMALCVVAVCGGSTLAQAQTWRLRQWQNPVPGHRLSGITSLGHELVTRTDYALGGFLRYPDGSVHDFGQQSPGGLYEDGAVIGSFDQMTRVWTPYGYESSFYAQSLGGNWYIGPFINRQARLGYLYDVYDGASNGNMYFSVVQLYNGGGASTRFFLFGKDVYCISDQGLFGGWAQDSNNVRRPAIMDYFGNPTFLSASGMGDGKVIRIDEFGNSTVIAAVSGSLPGMYYLRFNSALEEIERQFITPFTVNGSTVSDIDDYASENGQHHIFNLNLSNGRKQVYWSRNTGLIDLTANIEGLPSGATLGWIWRPTNSGKFLATYYRNNQMYDNVYFEPVPEPATLAALGVGVLALLRRRKARRG